jgi:predicted DNA repair protein MutK
MPMLYVLGKIYLRLIGAKKIARQMAENTEDRHREEWNEIAAALEVEDL